MNTKRQKCCKTNFNFCFLTLNCKGQGDELKRKIQYQYARDMKADIILFQETHSTKGTENIWKNQWGNGQTWFSHGESNARGVAIHVTNKVNPKVHNITTDSEGRWICLDIETHTQRFMIVNVYAPNDHTEQKCFYRKLREHLHNEVKKEHKLIIGGDFNLIMNPTKDKQGGRLNRNDAAREILNNLLEDHDLIDAWRAKNRFRQEFTFEQPSKGVRCRLDMWFIPADWLQMTRNCKIVPSVKTDHKAVEMTIKGKLYTPRGPGIWKLNTTVLQEENYRKIIEETIKIAKKDSIEANHNSWTKWEHIKSKCREASMKYCIERAAKRRKKELDLLDELKILEETVHELDEETLSKYKLTKEKLEENYEETVRGNIIRTRAKWIAQGEKSTKYFFGLEKRNFTNQCIYQLKTKNDKLLTNPREILNEVADHFQTFFEEKNITPTSNPIAEPFFRDVPKLNLEDKEWLESPLTEEELQTALFEMANNKSPGEDGLPAEFHKTFWNLIKDDFFECIQYCWKEKLLPDALCRGVIRLIPKPEKELLEIPNWRPITLLNVDYKILSKVLANRLKEVLKSLISEDQTGFVKGRYIGENIRMLLDLMEYMDETQTEGFLLSLDIEKAFDSIDHEFIFEALKAFGFGTNFIQWTKIIMKRGKSCAINNGYTSRYFELKRGTRQGDPISGYLFILALELLSICIRNHPGIEGIPINGMEYKLSQYADDTTVTVKNTESIKNVLIVLENFEKISGLRVNKNKTQACGLGKLKNCDELVHGIHVRPDPVKVLGIWLSEDKRILKNRNLVDKLGKIKRSLHAWHTRGLTLYGKSLILKSLGISQLVYHLMLLHADDKYLKEIEKFITEFIWNGPNKAKVKRTVLIQPYEKGGIKLPCIATTDESLKFGWAKRMLDEGNTKWCGILDYKLKKFGGLKYLLKCNFDENEVAKSGKINEFYSKILALYAKLAETGKNPNDAQKERGQIINNNRFIKIGRKTCFFNELKENRADIVANFLDIEGKPLPYDEIKTRHNLAKMNYLTYRQIISAIPGDWKMDMNEFKTPQIEIPSLYTNRQWAKQTLIQNRREEATALKTWDEIMEPKDDKFWERTFGLIRAVTKETKMQQFQFRIVHRILATNSRLHKYGKKESPNCHACPAVKDTVEHALLECPQVNQFWSSVIERFCQLEHSETFDPTIENTILGQTSNSQNIQKFNFVCLHAKYYIYLNRKDEKPLNPNVFFEIFKKKLQVHTLAKSNNMLRNQFRYKWQHWLPTENNE